MFSYRYYTTSIVHWQFSLGEQIHPIKLDEGTQYASGVTVLNILTCKSHNHLQDIVAADKTASPRICLQCIMFSEAVLQSLRWNLVPMFQFPSLFIKKIPHNILYKNLYYSVTHDLFHKERCMFGEVLVKLYYITLQTRLHYQWCHGSTVIPSGYHLVHPYKTKEWRTSKCSITHELTWCRWICIIIIFKLSDISLKCFTSLLGVHAGTLQ
jgi:hypothetical protein